MTTMDYKIVAKYGLAVQCSVCGVKKRYLRAMSTTRNNYAPICAECFKDRYKD